MGSLSRWSRVSACRNWKSDAWSNLHGSAEMNSSIPCFLARSASVTAHTACHTTHTETGSEIWHPSFVTAHRECHTTYIKGARYVCHICHLSQHTEREVTQHGQKGREIYVICHTHISEEDASVEIDGELTAPRWSITDPSPHLGRGIRHLDLRNNAHDTVITLAS